MVCLQQYCANRERGTTPIYSMFGDKLSSVLCLLVDSLVRVSRTLGVDFGCKTVELAKRRVRLQMVSMQSKNCCKHNIV